MGDHWWLLLIGAGMWAVMIATIVFGKRDPNACPKCAHPCGADRGVCEWGVDDNNGWSSTVCDCTSRYHTVRSGIHT